LYPYPFSCSLFITGLFAIVLATDSAERPTTYPPSQKKVGKVMREFKRGELHSGKKGPVVKNPKQAIAIALSEAYAGSKGNVGAYVTAITEIAKAGGITSDNLKTVATTIVEVSRVTGLSSETLAKNFSKISEKPLEGLIPFAKELGTINVEVLKHIQQLEKAGKYTEAAKIATDAYAGALRNAGKAIKEDMGFLEDFFFHIARGANMVWNEILNIGRATPLVKQLAKAQEELTSLQNGDGFMTDQYRKNSPPVLPVVKPPAALYFDPPPV